jgi:hypothetical protein
VSDGGIARPLRALMRAQERRTSNQCGHAWKVWRYDTKRHFRGAPTDTAEHRVWDMNVASDVGGRPSRAMDIARESSLAIALTGRPPGH